MHEHTHMFDGIRSLLFVALAVSCLPGCACLSFYQPDDSAEALDSSTIEHNDGTRSFVLYGVMTNNKPAYQEKLRAQVETWAAPLLENGRFFAVTGTGQGEAPSVLGLIATTCADNYGGVTCKEEQILETGASRRASWLVILGEDNYVDTLPLERHLAEIESTSPGALALGIVGCKMNEEYCPEAASQPSLCGGGGYALNSAALDMLMDGGKDALRAEYAKGSGLQGDLVTSCALRRRGIEIRELKGLVGTRVTAEKTLEQLVERVKPLTYHYLSAWVMRWIHAQLQGKPAIEVQAMSAEAFDKSCCCWCNNAEKEQCQSKADTQSTSFLAIQRYDLIPILRSLYISQRNAATAEHSMSSMGLVVG